MKDITEKEIRQAISIGKENNLFMPRILDSRTAKSIIKKDRKEILRARIESNINDYNKYLAARECKNFAQDKNFSSIYTIWHQCYCIKGKIIDREFASCSLVWLGKCEFNLVSSPPRIKHRFLGEKIIDFLTFGKKKKG